jgi:pimeloyl-ACP methyl ester carboxylesterase
MSRAEGWAQHKGVRLHYIKEEAADSLRRVPVVFVPGGLGKAEDFEEQLIGYEAGPAYAVTLRGSGKSDAPETGYAFEDFVADLECLIHEIGAPTVCLVAHSVAVPIVLEYTARHPAQVAGLILMDHAPKYPALPAGFADQVLKHAPPGMFIPHAIRSVERESREVDLVDRLPLVKCPVLLIRGGQPGTQVTDATVDVYRQNLQDFDVVVFPESGHDPRRPDPGMLIRLVHLFVARLPQR